jgi:parallel beta-helix repeat protein
MGAGRKGQHATRRVALTVVGFGVLAVCGGLVPIASAATAVTCGQTISAAGTYVMAADCMGPGITITASNVTLQLNGHTMTASPSGTGSGVLVDDSAGPVSGVGITGPGTITEYGPGVQLGNGGAGVTGSTVSGLTADNNANNGIYLETGATGNTVNSNTANNNLGYGIAVGGTDNTIKNNTADNNDPGGILIGGAANTVRDNTADTNSVDGIDVDGRGNTVNNNVVNTNNSDGIYVGGSGNAIHDNTTRGNGLTGIETPANDNTFYNNIADNNRVWGIALDFGAEGNTFHDNTALGNGALDLLAFAPCDSNNSWYNNKFRTTNMSCIH